MCTDKVHESTDTLLLLSASVSVAHNPLSSCKYSVHFSKVVRPDKNKQQQTFTTLPGSDSSLRSLPYMSIHGVDTARLNFRECLNKEITVTLLLLLKHHRCRFLCCSASAWHYVCPVFKFIER